MKIKEYRLGDMKVTEYGLPELTCKNGGHHRIRLCSTIPSYCIHCKKSEDELFSICEDHLGFIDDRDNLNQTKPKRQNLDDFME